MTRIRAQLGVAAAGGILTLSALSSCVPSVSLRHEEAAGAAQGGDGYGGAVPSGGSLAHGGSNEPAATDGGGSGQAGGAPDDSGDAGQPGAAGSDGEGAGPPFAELRADGFARTRALAVSADGVYVAGEASASGVQQAFRWQHLSGTSLGSLPGSTGSTARAISDDGTLVVGVSNTSERSIAFRWSGQLEELSGLSRGNSYSEATGLSGDGRIALGLSTKGTEMTVCPVQWLGDAVQELPLLAGDATATPSAASDDGSVLVGTGRTLDGHTVAERWPATGVASLGLPDSEANGVSGNGRFVVGAYIPDLMPGKAARVAFRWSASGLDVLPGPSDGELDCVATAASHDGSIVVGNCTEWVDQLVRFQPFLWSETRGTRSLEQVLAELGVDTSTFALKEITDVSADGRVVVGNITRAGLEVGFRARIETVFP